MSTLQITDFSDLLAQRFRRLGLLEDAQTLHELDAARIPREVQATLLSSSGTREVVRRWTNRQERELSTTELLIVLEHMRLRPSLVATQLKGLRGMDYDSDLAECALAVGKSLHRDGRRHYGSSRLDLSVNFMLAAQSEFLFALSTGRLSPSAKTQALGMYAVAVAFSSRSVRTKRGTLQRACQFLKQSISEGNSGPEAHRYLVELTAELFNATHSPEYLEQALEMAREGRFVLEEAELLLKRGIVTSGGSDPQSSQDLQTASMLAGEVTDLASGVEYVRRALVRNFGLCALIWPCPLRAHQIRFPYGFLGDLPQLSDLDRQGLRQFVVDELLQMRDELRGAGMPPNLVAQQVLVSVLRDSISHSQAVLPEDADLLVDIAGEANDRGQDRYLEYQLADALLIRARAVRQGEAASSAVAGASAVVADHPGWPLPQVTLASALQLEESFDESDAARDRTSIAWRQATRSVMGSTDYRRSDLGGRSSVFVVEDARGDLSRALVFKPAAQLAHAERESVRMDALGREIDSKNLGTRFGVPESLAIVPVEGGGSIHVIERQGGLLLSELSPEEGSEYLGLGAELLAHFHNVAGAPDKVRSGWRPVKTQLALWANGLFDTTGCEQFKAEMKNSFPRVMPLVRKRDAHPGNWLIDSTERLVAIDFESEAFLPVGYDLAQLIEDGAFLPVDREGFARRLGLMGEYLRVLNLEVDADAAAVAYDWFALFRALRIATSATATKSQHAHARLLAQYLAAVSELSGIRAPAERLASALSHFSPIEVGAKVDSSHRRRSKRLSRVLRHHAPEHGLEIDSAGFVHLDQLSRIVGLSVPEILSVAEHPAEPRFQVEQDRIRALYGHSFLVAELHRLDVETPGILYHGTSWDVLSKIAEVGLLPMGRQKVHLTNNPLEALEVARRHSRPALLAVGTGKLENPQAVADAVWAADSVAPEVLEVRNPFTEIASPPTWLTELDGPSVAGGTVAATDPGGWWRDGRK